MPENNIPPSALPENHIQDLNRLASWYWWHRHRVAAVLWLAKRFVPEPVRRYVDIGCGPGSATRMIADGLTRQELFDPKSPPVVAGWDSDPRLKRYCEENRVLFTLQNLDGNPPGPMKEKFEFFTALDVLEHLEFPQKFLLSFREYLVPGAVGVITVPAFQSLYSGWDKGLGHYRRYSLDEAKTLFKSCGYDVLYGSCLYSFLFFPAYIIRKLRGQGPEFNSGMEFPKVPFWMNKLLLWIGAVERSLLRIIPLPIGTSLILAVRKS